MGAMGGFIFLGFLVVGFCIYWGVGRYRVGEGGRESWVRKKKKKRKVCVELVYCIIHTLIS